MRPPNDVRNFVHKRIIGAATGFLTGGFTGAIGGAIKGGSSGRRGGAPTAPRRSLQTGTSISRGSGALARQVQCPPGRINIGNRCVQPTAILPGGVPFTTRAAGVAVMGQFGAALEPAVESINHRTCLPGMVLGKDGLCYNRRDISNKERAWPRGTRPLGTPGEMAALRKAASFGRRMETTVKRMQKIGVLKKPSRGARKAPPAAAPRQLAPGTTIVQN